MSRNRSMESLHAILVVGMLILPAAAHANYVLNDDFEGDTSGWTASGLWHKVASSPCTSPDDGYASPVNAFYYGQGATCNYNTGTANSGTLTSPVFSGIRSTSTLTFQYFREVEPARPTPEVKAGSHSLVDRTRVEIVTAGGATVVFALSSEDPSTATWVSSGAISLAQFAGQSIQVRFVFDTVDALKNNKIGWLVDDVVVTGTLPAPQVDGAGCRYLAVTPQAWYHDVAILVQGFFCVPGFYPPCPGVPCPVVDCVAAFVQADGTLGPDPVFQSTGQWGTAFVHGPEIVPDAYYTARIQDSLLGWGPAIYVGMTYRWGDTNGDCTVDQTDIDCAVDAFQGLFSQDCTIHSADVVGYSGVCSALDGVVDVRDISAIVDASQGQTFTCGDPCGP